MSCSLIQFQANILWLKHTLSNEDYHNHRLGWKMLAIGWPSRARADRDLRDLLVEIFTTNYRLMNVKPTAFTRGVEYRQNMAGRSDDVYVSRETLSKFFASKKQEATYGLLATFLIILTGMVLLS